MILPYNSKKQLFEEIDKQLEWLANWPEQERFSRFCWLANQVQMWEKENKPIIK